MSLEHRLCEVLKVRAVVVDLLIDLIRVLRDSRYPSSSKPDADISQPSSQLRERISNSMRNPQTKMKARDPASVLSLMSNRYRRAY